MAKSQLHFATRDMFWLTTLIAVIVCWQVQNARHSLNYQAAMDQGFPLNHDSDSLAYKAGPKFTAAIEALATKEVAQRRWSLEARTGLIQEYRALKAQIEADH